MAIEQRLPTVNGDDGIWGDNLNAFLGKEHYNGDATLTPGSSTNGGHKVVTLQPGTATSGTAPLKFTSGTLLSAAEAGAVEFNTDKLYYSTTATVTRMTIAAYPTSGGTLGDLYYRSSGGSLTVLPATTNTHVLTLAGGVPTWAAPPGGGSGLTQPQVMAISSMRI